MNKSVRVIGALVLILVGVVAFLIWNFTRPNRMGGDFSASFQGQPWSFSQAPRRVNLVYFGFISCPDACPLTLSHAGDAFTKLKATELEKVRLIFFTVDPHDTAAKAAAFASGFYKDFLGVRGTEEQTLKATNLLGASFMIEQQPKSFLGYSVTHSDRLFFLNSSGEVIDSIGQPRSSEEILNKIRSYL